MRVISGTAKSLKLVTPEGMDTRPTTDRIKETLFNMIQNNLADAVFVDCFSGSGAIGIEALSRGAKTAYFCDTDKKAIQCIKTNLEHTHLMKNACVLSEPAANIFTYVKEPVIDFVFMDPPYEKGLEKNVLIQALNSGKIDEETTIIIEAKLTEDFSYLAQIGYEIIKEKIYKTNKHIFVKMKI